MASQRFQRRISQAITSKVKKPNKAGFAADYKYPSLTLHELCMLSPRYLCFVISDIAVHD